MPNRNTFQIEVIRQLIGRYYDEDKVVIDPFARNSNLANITNDLNPKTKAQYHLPALDFQKIQREKGIQADLILFDPPYSLRQVKECYEGIGKEFMHKDSQNSTWSEEKDVCADLIKKYGYFIHFGWHSNGIGKLRNFSIIEILLVAHGGGSHDTIVTVECKFK